MYVLKDSAILKETVYRAVRRISATGVFDEQMQTANGVNYHWVINNTRFVNFVQILERICKLRIYIWLATIFLSLLLICANFLYVKAEDGIGIFAQPTNATEQQNFWLRNLAGCKSSQWNRHFDI